MPSFDLDLFTSTSLSKSKDLASTLFKKYVSQAESDTSDFVQRSKDGIARAWPSYAEKKIDRDDFEDLILGKKDLAEMHALKEAGLASAAIDTFTNGILQILIDAASAAVKF